MSSKLDRYRWGTAAAIALILSGCLIALYVPAGLGWDFANFYDAGRRFAAGQHEDLYHQERLIQGREPQGSMEFWGVPLSAALYAPLSLFGPETALVVFKTQNIAAYFVALGLLFFHLRPLSGSDEEEVWRFTTWFWLAALLYQPFWTVFRVGGQSTPTVFLLCVMSLLAHTRGRFGWSSLLLICAVMIKPALALAFVVLTLLSPGRFWLYSAVHGLALGSISILFLGLDVHLELIQKLLGAAGGVAAWKDNSSLYIIPEHLRGWTSAIPGGLGPRLPDLLIQAVRLGVVATVAFVYWRSRRQSWTDAGRRRFAFDLALLFFLLFALTIWEHYLTLLFPLLTFLLARRAAVTRLALAVVVAIMALCILQNLIVARFLIARFGMDTFPEVLLAAAYKSAPLWLVMFFLLRCRDSLFAAYARPLAVGTAATA